METSKDRQYQKELFEKLKKSVSLRKEEQCMGECLKPALWWLIEKPNPAIAEIKKVIYDNCPYLKRHSAGKRTRCIKAMLGVLRKASKDRVVAAFDCIEGLHGFVYPITQGDKLYG